MPDSGARVEKINSGAPTAQLQPVLTSLHTLDTQKINAPQTRLHTFCNDASRINTAHACAENSPNYADFKVSFTTDHALQPTGPRQAGAQPANGMNEHRDTPPAFQPTGPQQARARSLVIGRHETDSASEGRNLHIPRQVLSAQLPANACTINDPHTNEMKNEYWPTAWPVQATTQASAAQPLAGNGNTQGPHRPKNCQKTFLYNLQIFPR